MFRRKKTKAAGAIPPADTVVDHSLAEDALTFAVEAHMAAQEQAIEAHQAVAELRQVNLRNGFAPAIRDSFTRRYGGAI